MAKIILFHIVLVPKDEGHNHVNTLHCFEHLTVSTGLHVITLVPPLGLRMVSYFG